MNIGNRILILAISSVLFACGSTSNKTSLAKENTEGLICKSEKVLGSKIPKKVCRTPEQMEAEMLATQDAARRMRTSGRADGNTM